MQAMTELRSLHYGYWVRRYGTIFIVGSLGFILITLTIWKTQGIFFSLPLTLFTITSFFREPLDKLWGEPLGNALFGVAIIGCALGLLLLAWEKKTRCLLQNAHTFTLNPLRHDFPVWISPAPWTSL